MNLEKSEELKAISKEDIDMLKDRGMVDGFLDRVVESKTSIAVKYVVNFIFALIKFINVPGFISVLLVAINPILQVFDKDAAIPTPVLIEIAFYLIIGYLILKQLREMTIQNLVSSEISLIWFINFFKATKNPFYSVSAAEKHYKNLEDYVQKQTEHYLQRQIKDYKESLYRLTLELESINQLDNFPNDTFTSYQRLLSRMGNFIDHKYAINGMQDLRNKLENILDDILIELCNFDALQNKASSACILVGSNQFYEPMGQYRYPAEGINKIQRVFPEYIVDRDEFTYIPDVSKEVTFEDFFHNTKPLPYTSVIAYPITLNLPAVDENPKWRYMKYAVICIFLNGQRNFHDAELSAIVNTLNVYANFIQLAIRIDLHNQMDEETEKTSK